MKLSKMILVALILMAPAKVSAHGPGGHPADPALHVNSTLKDCSVQFSSDLTQDAFRRFVREFGSVSAFKWMAAPKPLGKWGFELALDQMQFTVEEHDDAWNDTFAHPDAYHELGSDLSFPKVRVRLGITDRMDVGAYYTENPNANYGWAGVDLSYSVMQQSETTPIHLAVRGAYTMTLYVADMDMHTLTADVAAGHTLWNYFTPYLGVGGDIVAAQERTNAVALEGEGQFVPRAFGGVEASIWHAAVGAEAEVGALNRLEFKVSAVF